MLERNSTWLQNMADTLMDQAIPLKDRLSKIEEMEKESQSYLSAEIRRKYNLEPEGSESKCPIFHPELESFHYEMCIRCNWYLLPPINHKPIEKMDDFEKQMLNAVIEHRKKLDQKPRKLFAHRGQHYWCWICEKCKPAPVKQKTENDFKQRVKELLK